MTVFQPVGNTKLDLLRNKYEQGHFQLPQPMGLPRWTAAVSGSSSIKVAVSYLKSPKGSRLKIFGKLNTPQKNVMHPSGQDIFSSYNIVSAQQTLHGCFPWEIFGLVSVLLQAIDSCINSVFSMCLYKNQSKTRGLHSVCTMTVSST